MNSKYVMKSVTNAHFVKRRINSIIVILNLCYLKLSCFFCYLYCQIFIKLCMPTVSTGFACYCIHFIYFRKRVLTHARISTMGFRLFIKNASTYIGPDSTYIKAYHVRRPWSLCSNVLLTVVCCTISQICILKKETLHIYPCLSILQYYEEDKKI